MPLTKIGPREHEEPKSRVGFDLLDALAAEGLTLAAGVALVTASLASLLSLEISSLDVSGRQWIWHGLITLVGAALLVRALVVHHRIRRRLDPRVSEGSPVASQTPSDAWPASFWQAFAELPEDFERPPQHRQQRESFDP